MVPLPHGHAGGTGNSKQNGPRRHRKILKDNIMGVTKPAIRRLARRGGVKRISGMIYDDIRKVIRERLRELLFKLVEVTVYCGRKTITTLDVVFVLKRMGSTIYGFDDEDTRRARR